MDEQMLGLYVVMRGDLSSVLSNEAGRKRMDRFMAHTIIIAAAGMAIWLFLFWRLFR